MNTSRRFTVLLFFVALLLGGVLAWIARPIFAPTSGDHAHADEDTQYTCPMHPAILSDGPGTCPICHMDLIPKKAAEGTLDDDTLEAVAHIALNPVQRVLANVHTTQARAPEDGYFASDDGQANRLDRDIRAPGVMAADQDSLADVTSWLDGRIERLHVQRNGARVTRGQAIVDVYSPDLYAAQQEYLLARHSTSEDAQSLAQLSRKRLELLGMDARQIRKIERDEQPIRAVTLRATHSGTVTDVLVRQGQYVNTGTPLLRIENLDDLRVEAAVRMHELPFVARGARARIVADGSSEERTGTIEFISPILDAATRTVNVRIKLDDASPWLPKDAFVTVHIQRTPPASNAHASDDANGDPTTALLIPRTAVIQTGRFNRVYVETDKNIFEPRDVDVTAIDAQHFLVTRGLKLGDAVVTSGAFLIDSEAQLHAFGTPPNHRDHEDPQDHAHHDDNERIDRDTIPKDGKKFDPPLPIKQAPDDVWLCDMSDHAHWIQADKNDGICPLCNMKLTHHTVENPAPIIDRDTIPKDGKKFDPPLPIKQAPDDVWLCDMSDHAHWIQTDKNDGVCPLCNMKLTHHPTETQPSENKHNNHDAHDHSSHEHPAEDHP